MAGFSSNNSIQLIHAGKEFFGLVKKLIDSATHSIHLHTYIFANDETGTAVAEALIKAAERKVKVYVLADGYASSALPSAFLKKFAEAGISFRFFQPLLKSRSLYFGRRLHHKVIVIDGVNAIVGGINIADRYNDLPGEPAWLDLALFVYGDASLELYQLCCRLWSRKRSKVFALPPVIPKKVTDIHSRDHCLIRVRRNDWVKRRHDIWKTYMEIFRTSQEKIIILCSYFMPGKTFRKEIEKASKKGVVIKVILTGRSDVWISKYGERYLYRWMLRNNILIYEYKPRILHAKIAVADHRLLTIGSYNLNNISAFASIELNLDVRDTIFSEQVETELEQIITNDCLAITSGNFNLKLYSIKQFFHWGAFQIIRFFLNISTFYFRQKE